MDPLLIEKAKDRVYKISGLDLESSLRSGYLLI